MTYLTEHDRVQRGGAITLDDVRYVERVAVQLEEQGDRAGAVKLADLAWRLAGIVRA